MLDAFERFKLLIRKFSNYNMSSMEHMTHFTSRLTTPTQMLIDALTGGTLRANIEEEVKTLIENMCQNEYRSSDRVVMGKYVLAFDTQTTLLA